jgi:glycosyltransferase involved in cell wall biosynthesis
MDRITNPTASHPIRVLYLDHTAKLSGAELSLARLLGALDRARVEPIVVLAEDGPLYELLTQQSVDTHVVPLNEKLLNVRKDSLGLAGLIRQIRSLRSLWRYSRRLGQFAREQRVHLIYANSLKSDFYGAIAARLAGVPLIWHMHDRIDDHYLPRLAAWLVRLLASCLPICVVANSTSTLETLRLRCTKRSAIIASGLTRDHIERSWVPRRSNPIPQIGIVGRIAHWKGQDIFLQAAALLLREGVAARFRIAGSPMFGEVDFERQLYELAQKLGIRKHVEFLGFSDVPSFLRSLDILVHASRIPEPFGQVIVEGMAAELPVIATDGGGAREIIEHGRTGLLVPMGDAAALSQALAQLLARPEQARALAVAGRQHVLEHFTIEKSARCSEALYQRLLRASV